MKIRVKLLVYILVLVIWHIIYFEKCKLVNYMLSGPVIGERVIQPNQFLGYQAIWKDKGPHGNGPSFRDKCQPKITTTNRNLSWALSNITIDTYVW